MYEILYLEGRVGFEVEAFWDSFSVMCLSLLELMCFCNVTVAVFDGLSAFSNKQLIFYCYVMRGIEQR